MVASTNHLDQLDPGLSSRPSRFDRKYLFPLPSEAERIMYCDYCELSFLNHYSPFHHVMRAGNLSRLLIHS